MNDLIVNLWKSTGINTWNRWQKGVGDTVGEADDDVPLKLKWCTIAAENKGGESYGSASFDTSSRLHILMKKKTI